MLERRLIRIFRGVSRTGVQVMTDRKPGVARQTDNPLDIALLGDGYFEVRTDSGVAYTRQGYVQTQRPGTFSHTGWFPVAGAAGDILLTSAKPTIDRQGRVFGRETSCANQGGLF